jgi:transposase-like protein
MPRVPDGRTVLTEPGALNSCNGPVMRRRWHLPPFIPDTNAIEALNRQLRKAIKTKGSFPNEDAARKLVYLALQNAVPQWTCTRNWTTALLAFEIHFGDRVPGTAN